MERSGNDRMVPAPDKLDKTYTIPGSKKYFPFEIPVSEFPHIESSCEMQGILLKSKE